MGVLMLVGVSVVMVTLSAAVSALRPDLVLKMDKERPNGLTVSVLGNNSPTNFHFHYRKMALK